MTTRISKPLWLRPGRPDSLLSGPQLRSRSSGGSSTSLSPSPNRGQDQKRGKMVTKVRKVVIYRNGKLRHLLLPMLVAASTVSDMQSMPQTEEYLSEDPYQEYAGSSGDEDHEAIIDKKTTTAQRSMSFKEGLAKAFSKLKLSGELGNVNLRPRVHEKFIDTLLHTLDCRNCEDTACKKMSFIIGHFMTCNNFGSDMCPICSQLISILSGHASECRVHRNEDCPVPMCNVLRSNENAEKGEPIGKCFMPQLSTSDIKREVM